MADEPVGFYDPPTAERIWRAVQWLERSGFMTGKGQKQQFNPPPERPIYVKNVSGFVIPMFGCVQAIDTTMMNDQCFLNVTRPVDNTGEAGPYFLNLFHEIPAVNSQGEFQYGLVTDGPHANALSPDLDAGTQLRPVVDSFELEEGSGPFIMIGPNDGQYMPQNAQRVMVSSSTSVAHIIQFTLAACSDGNATVNEILCGRSRPVPGETNGCVTVVDTMGCLTLEDGAIGWAAWVTTGTGDCYWSIFSLCCPTGV